MSQETVAVWRACRGPECQVHETEAAHRAQPCQMCLTRCLLSKRSISAPAVPLFSPGSTCPHHYLRSKLAPTHVPCSLISSLKAKALRHIVTWLVCLPDLFFSLLPFGAFVAFSALIWTWFSALNDLFPLSLLLHRVNKDFQTVFD